jgi:Ala-tRNA(Pro) deacylase
MSTTTIHASDAKLLAELDAAEIDYAVIPHRRTQTALDEAKALGVPPGRVAKTIILTSPGGFLRAVIPASEHLDLGKVRDLLGTGKVELATEEQLAGAYPDFELGAVPPIGGGKDTVLIDTKLAAGETVLIEAGVHDASVRLTTDALLAHSGARVVDLCRG